MKVLQINSVCGIGSTGRIATDIHNLLIKQGHESYIAYGRNVPNHCNNFIKIGNKFDNYAHVAKTRILDKHALGSKKSTLEFLDRIKELNPDIIHLHNIHGYYINIEILFNYLKKINKPVIWTLHDCWSFTGHCSHFDYIGCDKWKDYCFDCPQKNLYPKSILLDNSKRNYSKKKELFSGIENLTIITPSKWLSRLVKESFLDEYPIEVINNGINLDIFKPINNNFREKYNIKNKFVILGVANVWGKRKGYNYFIEISELLKDDEVIVIVGLSEKHNKRLPKNIIGISKTNNTHELAEIYSTADIFVNPTLEDTFPTTNLESLACGTPVITFNTGGSIESIDQNTGSIVYDKNSQSLYNEISNYKNEHTDTCFSCVNRANSLYNKDDRYGDYIKKYKEMMNMK